MRTVLSLEADASVCPSGDQATLLMLSWCSVNVYISCSVSGFQRQIVASSDPEARVRPSGDQAILLTSLACWVSVESTVLEPTSHNRIDPSSDPEARTLPSGDQAILLFDLVGVFSSARSSPVFVFHKNKKRMSPVASIVPSGDHAKLKLKFPSSVCRIFPVFVSHR